MRISVVIPSYRRTDVLGFCLDALFGQDRLADELIVVVREDDERSRTFLTSYEHVRCVLVNQAGAVHAMAHGALASSGDIICFTDDDARPHRDWLSRIEAGFLAEPALAALGGRDCIHEADGSPRPTLLTEEVGIFRSYGRLIGNHHRGQGQARRVDVLKGVNSAYRREALALPLGLRDRHGGQFEVVMGAFIQRNGGQLSYDPELQVDHYPNMRKANNQRGAPSRESVAGHAYNLSMAASVKGPAYFLARVLYACIIGDAAMPGLLRSIYALLKGDRETSSRLRAALSGNLAAAKDWILGKRLSFLRPEMLQ